MNSTNRLVLEDRANLLHQCTSSRASGCCPCAEEHNISDVLDENIVLNHRDGRWTNPDEICLHGRTSEGSCSVLSSKRLEGTLHLLILRTLEVTIEHESSSHSAEQCCYAPSIRCVAC